jgi:hypothetical protein
MSQFTAAAGVLGRSIHDCPERSASEVRDEAVERAREEVISYLRVGSADLDELIPMLDGDGTRLLCRVLLDAYEQGRGRIGYTDAEALVDALAQAEADREAMA